MSIGKRSRTLEDRMFERYPEGLLIDPARC